MFPPIVARYPVFCVWTVVFGIQNRGTDCGAPINMVLLVKYQPTRGAVPAFLAVPPHVFVLLQIDAEFLLILPADI